MRRATVLVALVLVPAAGAPGATAADCAKTSVGFTPLTDLATSTYHGFTGGLYPGGRNTPSPAYLQKGLAFLGQVTPRAADGRPGAGGRIVLLSLGMSNATQEFSAFEQLAERDPRKSPAVTIVDGAQGGQDAEKIKDPAARFWSVVDLRLERAGVTAKQVQAVWLKEAIARPVRPFPADARRLQADLRAILTIMQVRYPNLRLVFLSSRTYGGYATTALNPEPYAYDSGFAVKWTVQDRIEGRLRGPWVGWGPYLWTDGTRGRSDGFTWTCADTRADGTHPSPSGRRKVAELLLRFFTSDPLARAWFVKAP
jgi:hypothetical protein